MASVRSEAEVEIRMRCLEAAARPGAFNPAHQGGPTKAILESAEAFAQWVLSRGAVKK